MSYDRMRSIAAGSTLALFIGCGGGANESNSSAGSGSGATTNTMGGSTSKGGSGGASATGGSAGTTTMMSSGGAAGTGATGGSGMAGTGVAAGTGGALSMGGAGGASSGGAGAGSGAAGMSAGMGGSAVTGGLTLTIEPNPNSVVSCLVSWKTDAPASSVVQFGLTDYLYEISDDTMVTDLHEVRIVHGHGTGQLRKGLHAFLKTHPQVEKYYAAPDNQGGGGATIVELKE